MSDDSDDGVEFHVHEDGTRHAIMKINVRRTPWWRSPAMYRRFRWEILLIALYAAWAAAGILLWGLAWSNLLTSVAMLILLSSIVIRSISSYRIGYTMGIAAMPLAMTQPSPKEAAELIERASELWDPTPAAVAHTMEIERLERDVNRGNAGR